MDKISGSANVIYNTKAEAIKAANAHVGSEAIIKTTDNKFELRTLNPTETNNVIKRNFDKLGSPATVVAFSMDKSGKAADKVVDNSDGKGAKMYHDAENVLKNIDKGAKTSYQHKDSNLYNTDCSGFIRQLADTNKTDKDKGIFADQDAAGICDTIRNNKNIQRIMKPSDIKPGDVISFKIRNRDISGHAMLAGSKPPVPIYKDGKLAGYNISIIDSTSVKHDSKDQRRKGNDGIGEGVITIGVDKAGNATKVTWGPGFTKANRDYHSITIGRLK